MSVRVITNDFGGSPITRAFLSRATPQSWFDGPPSDSPAGEFWKARVSSIAGDFRGNDWVMVLREAFGPSLSGAAAERLERAGRGGVVVTTGQQPGLFGGPLYTLSKALTALAMADELEKLTGSDVAPIFWAATDDADFAEASTIGVPAGESAIELSMKKRDDVQRPLADEPLPEMGAVLEEFLRGVGSSADAGIVEMVRDVHAGEPTVGASYVALLRRILEPLGIAVLDAAHPAVRAAGFPMMQSALANAQAVAKALSDRNAAIRAAGFKEQVREVSGKSLVFRYSSERKERIAIARAGAAGVDAKPGELSPTVLLRPIMERAILPTVAYVGGPAEVGYFAQVSAVADSLGADRPIVVPRWSGTVIEPRVERILSRHSLSPGDFADPHALEGQDARRSIPAEIQALIQRLRESVTFDSAYAAGEKGTALLPDSVVAGLQRDLSRRVERFERRAAAAVKRSGTESLRDIRIARASLFPFGKPQERVVSFVALLARYGSDLQQRMLEAARIHVSELI